MEQEKNELDLLIGNGFPFKIHRKIKKRKSGFLGFFQAKVEETETLEFKIQEPTLATLDRISREQIELDLDETELTSDNALQNAKLLVNKHAKRCAKILAIAVLGNDYIKANNTGFSISYDKDDKKLNELTELFYTYIKPSEMLQLYTLVNTISNLSGFINSIRLMSASRTTIPIRVED